MYSGQPTNQQSVHEQPMNPQHVHEQPVYPQQMNQQPVYETPVYEQSFYKQPIKPQPVYEKPIYPQVISQQPINQNLVNENQILKFPQQTTFQQIQSRPPRPPSYLVWSLFNIFLCGICNPFGYIPLLFSLFSRKIPINSEESLQEIQKNSRRAKSFNLIWTLLALIGITITIINIVLQ